MTHKQTVSVVVSLCSAVGHRGASRQMAESSQAAEPEVVPFEADVSHTSNVEEKDALELPPKDRTAAATEARPDSRRDSRAAASTKVMTTFPRYNVKPGSALAVTRKQSLKREEGAFARDLNLFFRKLCDYVFPQSVLCGPLIGLYV